jgi:hypothetical protein
VAGGGCLSRDLLSSTGQAQGGVRLVAGSGGRSRDLVSCRHREACGRWRQEGGVWWPKS